MFSLFNIYVIMAVVTWLYLFAYTDSDYKLPISRELLYITAMAILWPIWVWIKFGDK